jgi:fermentation-respiration switch protein FrsA (DUF1100 family)
MSIEHRFLFFPESHIYYTPDQFGLMYEDIFYQTEDGETINAWYVPTSPDAPVVIFCHGNAGNISHRLPNIRLLSSWGVSTFIFDYRGFGQSTGEITEEGMYLDALGAYRFLTEDRGIDSERLVPFGRSMGGPVAVDLAARIDPPCLVVESTFTRLSELVKSVYPDMGLETQLTMEFNAEEKIEKVGCPVLFIHGDMDDIVDYRLGRALFEKAGEPKRFYTISGAMHNDTFDVGGEEYFSTLAGFVMEYMS